MDDKDVLETLVEIEQAFQRRGFTQREVLEVLEVAWLTTSQEALNGVLHEPGAFPAEQARQLGRLGLMLALVRDTQPDLEL